MPLFELPSKEDSVNSTILEHPRGGINFNTNFYSFSVYTKAYVAGHNRGTSVHNIRGSFWEASGTTERRNKDGNYDAYPYYNLNLELSHSMGYWHTIKHDELKGGSGDMLDVPVLENLQELTEKIEYQNSRIAALIKHHLYSKGPIYKTRKKRVWVCGNQVILFEDRNEIQELSEDHKLRIWICTLKTTPKARKYYTRGSNVMYLKDSEIKEIEVDLEKDLKFFLEPFEGLKLNAENRVNKNIEAAIEAHKKKSENF